jgi:hypothetical protein
MTVVKLTAGRAPPLHWRDCLTADERRLLERADAAKAVWLELNKAWAGIQNRAIHRAKYARRKGKKA